MARLLGLPLLRGLVDTLDCVLVWRFVVSPIVVLVLITLMATAVAFFAAVWLPLGPLATAGVFWQGWKLADA